MLALLAGALPAHNATFCERSSASAGWGCVDSLGSKGWPAPTAFPGRLVCYICVCPCRWHLLSGQLACSISGLPSTLQRFPGFLLKQFSDSSKAADELVAFNLKLIFLMDWLLHCNLEVCLPSVILSGRPAHAQCIHDAAHGATGATQKKTPCNRKLVYLCAAATRERILKRMGRPRPTF